MSQFKGSAFPRHMDKGDVTWIWSLPFTAASVREYLALVQDPNPIHTSDEAARSAGLAGTVVSGMYFAGVAELILIRALPDCAVENMKLRFMAPVLIGEKVRYGVLMRAKTENGHPKVVRVFVLRTGGIIASVADITMQSTA